MTGRDALWARIVAALETAHETHPCSCGSHTWSSCFHEGALKHSERRADAVMAVVDEVRAEVLREVVGAIQVRRDELSIELARSRSRVGMTTGMKLALDVVKKLASEGGGGDV